MEIQNMTFFGIEPFDANQCGNNRNPSTASVTVSADRITIPKYTFEKFGSPRFVEVGFNYQKCIFAIKPVDKETKYSIEINRYCFQIMKKTIVSKIHELHEWDWVSANIVLRNGNYDNESGYWLFDLDDADVVGKRSYVRRPNRRK